MSKEIVVKTRNGVVMSENEHGYPFFCSQVKPLESNKFYTAPRIVSGDCEIYNTDSRNSQNFVRVDDPTGEQWRNATSIICFHHRSDEEIKAISKKRHNVEKAYSDYRAARQGFRGWFNKCGGWTTVLLNFLGLSGWIWLMVGSGFTADPEGVVLTSFISLIIFLVISGLSRWYNEDTLRFEDKLSKKRDKRIQKAVESSTGFSAKDEMVSLGTGSLVPSLVEDFKQVVPLVKDKLRTGPDPVELQSWCAVVREIMEFQKPLKNGLPVAMIPLMTEDARGTFEELKERVEFLSNEHEYNVKELSQATRFGAKSFIDNMRSNDL